MLQLIAALALIGQTAPSGALALGVADTTAYDPAWASAPSLRTIPLDFDPALTPEQNGAALKSAVLGLVAGDRLVVGAGTWSVNSLFSVSAIGTAAAPIRIEAAPGAVPVITRPNAGQNVMNLGIPTSGGPLRFTVLRGFEITGGSIGIRTQDARDVWIDRCHIHHTGAATFRASSDDTQRLTITRCEIHDPSQVNGTGEGIYLGANFASITTQNTVVALNHVHHTLNAQGDGIELKQGSWGCVIAENVVHDTRFPGILCYGTAGPPRNVIRGNLIYRTNANALQVQGDALVENNVVIADDQHAFVSFNHQGTVQNLEVIGNTFVSRTRDAARLQRWSNAVGMVLANNALYSESSYGLHSLDFSFAGVQVENNVVFGDIRDGNLGGHIPGVGLSDFTALTWDATQRDAHPSRQSALLGVGDPGFGSGQDKARALRPAAPAVGALEYGTYGTYLGEASPSAVGTPRLLTTGPPLAGGAPVNALLTGAAPGQFTVFFLYAAPGQGASFAVRALTMTDAGGNAGAPVDLPSDPAFAGLSFEGLWVARDPVAASGLSRTQRVRWAP